MRNNINESITINQSNNYLRLEYDWKAFNTSLEYLLVKAMNDNNYLHNRKYMIEKLSTPVSISESVKPIPDMWYFL